MVLANNNGVTAMREHVCDKCKVSFTPGVNGEVSIGVARDKEALCNACIDIRDTLNVSCTACGKKVTHVDAIGWCDDCDKVYTEEYRDMRDNGWDPLSNEY